MFLSLNKTILVKKRCLQSYRVLFVNSRGVKDQNNIFHLSLFSLHGFDPSRVTPLLARGQDVMNAKAVRHHKGREQKRLRSAGDLEGFA